MELYNALIRSIPACLGPSVPRRYAYNEKRIWEETDSFSLVMARDAACELGGDGLPAVNFTCVTTSPELVARDETVVCGPEVRELPSSAPFARITVLRVGDIEGDDDDTEQTYRAIQSMDFIKYHVYPQGYMMRTSSASHREQVRISREAVRSGISFERIGNTFIRRYQENSNILAVRMLFVTAADADYSALLQCANQVGRITRGLTKILEGMSTDCSVCSLKPICDEVEGMRELHFGREKHTTE